MVDRPHSESTLAELAVLIVDCQTTGATPAQGAVLELGWCVVCVADEARDVAPQAHWVTPPAGERISAQVRQLTGFHEGVLATAISPEDAWQRLRAATSHASTTPAAIHYARFELSFLRAWSERFEPTCEFAIDAVCVHAIACRLFPDLPRRNLRALAGFLGHGLHLERRSLGHVQATAFIWRRLVAELAARDVTTWSELAAWLADKPRAQPRKRRYPLAPQTYRGLPDQPGVYRFLRSNGDVLYVGKATSLKKRVSSHFTKQRGATERALEMLTQVGEIAFTATATALEAALLETQTIKLLTPPYNVQLVQGERGVWFCAADFGDAADQPSEVYRFGPLSSRFSVRALAALATLLEGEPPSASVRAASVGAPVRWAPDETSFAAGWAMFAERHLRPLEAPNQGRKAVRAIAQRLLASSLLDDSTTTADDQDDASPQVWDGPRVCRHLERAVAQAYQVLRRASWLCLLANSAVAYREPASKTARVLVLNAGNIGEITELESGSALATPTPTRRARLATQQGFDAARYDSLRILTTELKRVLRDGGEVQVRLSHRRVLEGARLAQLLRLV